MNKFYLGKHRKRIILPILKHIKNIVYLIWLDFVWYCKWWKKLIIKMGDIYRHMNDISITMIDKWDLFYDKIVEKIVRYISLLHIIITLNLQSPNINSSRMAWIRFLKPQPSFIYTLK